MIKYVTAFFLAFFVSTAAFAQDKTEDDVSAASVSGRQEVKQELNEAQIFEKQMLARRDAKMKRGRTKRLSGNRSGGRSRRAGSSSGGSSSGGGFSLSSGMFVK